MFRPRLHCRGLMTSRLLRELVTAKCRVARRTAMLHPRSSGGITTTKFTRAGNIDCVFPACKSNTLGSWTDSEPVTMNDFHATILHLIETITSD